jgi:hypothetical protein
MTHCAPGSGTAGFPRTAKAFVPLSLFPDGEPMFPPVVGAGSEHVDGHGMTFILTHKESEYYYAQKGSRLRTKMTDGSSCR